MSKTFDTKSYCRKISEGDAYSMHSLAVAEYWKYADSYLGIRTDELLDAEATNGASFSERVADFYRSEYQNVTAAKYYKQAYSQLVLETNEGKDANTKKYQLGEYHAFGRGTSQNHERAYFWNLSAAYKNEADAIDIMPNFWQDGGAVPVNRDMAEIWHKNAVEKKKMQPHGEAAELFSAASIAASCEEKIEAIEYFETNPVPSYEIVYLRANEKAKKKEKSFEKFQDKAFNVGVVYALISLVFLVINAFSGYHSSGILNIFNKIFYVLLGFPSKIFIALTSEAKFSEITIEQVCDYFAVHGLFGIFSLAAQILLFGIWILICTGIFILVIGLLDASNPDGLKVTKHSDKNKQAQLKTDKQSYRSQLAQARAKIEEICNRAGIAVQDNIKLVALCDIATAKNVSLSEANELYNSYCSENEKPTYHPLHFTSYDSRKYNKYHWYFLLRNMGYAYSTLPEENLPKHSSFSSAYLHYRIGKNYKKSERKLLDVTKSETASSLEKAYAHWHLAAFYLNEGMPIPVSIRKCYDSEKYWTKTDKNAIEEAKKKVDSHLRRARINKCPFSKSATAFWSMNPEAIKMFRDKVQDDEVLYKYLGCLLKSINSKLITNGNPLRRSTWNGADTGNLWVEYKECLAEFEKVAADRPKGEFELHLYDSTKFTPIKERLSKSYNKGLVRLDMLYKYIEDIISYADYILNQKSEERSRQNEIRQRKIDQEMSEYAEHLDDIERAANFFINDSYKTEQERLLTDEISQNDFMSSDMLREDALRRHREKLENETD